MSPFKKNNNEQIKSFYFFPTGGYMVFRLQFPFASTKVAISCGGERVAGSISALVMSLRKTPNPQLLLADCYPASQPG